jgi:hypothetical protein
LLATVALGRRPYLSSSQVVALTPPQNAVGMNEECPSFFRKEYLRRRPPGGKSQKKRNGIGIESIFTAYPYRRYAVQAKHPLPPTTGPRRACPLSRSR